MIVVGGGVGGLAVAIRVAAAGHEVLLVERNDVIGGKLATYARDGYTFDIGPSLVTLPHLFDELFELAGSPSAPLDLVRLDPQFRYHWGDGSTLTVADDSDETAAAFEAFTEGAGVQWRSFDDRGRRIWDVAERTFLAGPITSPVALARRLRSPFDITAIDGFRTLHRSAASYFDDDRLVQWAGRYATYSGSTPFRAPATLACIPHIEARHGCWYPIGGLGTIRDALERLARACGVDPHRNGGNRHHRRLRSCPRCRPRRRHRGRRGRRRGERGCRASLHRSAPRPGGVTTRAPRRAFHERLRDLRHGTRPHAGAAAPQRVVLRGRAGEFEAIGRGELPDDPTIYGCVSAVTDPSQAPDGCENWFLLVNTPPGVEIEPDRGTDLVLRRLAMHGVPLDERIEFVHTMTPADIAARYRSPGGAIYGTSSDGMRAAFTRPANRGTRAGLYLVGGSAIRAAACRSCRRAPGSLPR